jgi:flagellar biosynthesis/type III secretory pathway M-ring protein FliF/YscJ
MRKTIIFLIAAVLIIIGVILVFRQKPAQGITLFYGLECPHCANVEQYMQKNKIEEKVKIDKKEVYHDQDNAQELGAIASGCGKDTNQIGVPFLYDGKSCYEGEDEVKNYLSQYIVK